MYGGGAENDFNSIQGQSFGVDEVTGPTPIVNHKSPKQEIRANLNLTIDLANKRDSEVNSPVEFGAGAA